MFEERLIRQRDIIPEGILATRITCIGCGAIGSHAVKALAQMGFHNIEVFDDDIVEIENMNAQGFPLAAMGLSKVEAIKNVVKEYTGIDIQTRKERYVEGRFPGIVISAVDNMATRRLIWDQHQGKAIGTLAIIDPRMGAEQALLYTMKPMQPKDETGYRKTLHRDEDGVMERCTAKSTIYTAMLLAGLVTKAVKDILTGAAVYPRVVAWDIGANDFTLWGPKIDVAAVG